MPYITRDRRRKLNPAIAEFVAEARQLKDLNVGDMNYIFTTLIRLLKNPRNYAEYNEMMGLLECVKHELYRRKIAPYEDKKRKLNGDVY